MRARATALLLAAAALAAPAGAADLPDGARLARTVALLADPAFVGRGAGTPGGAAAVDTLARRLQELGLTPAFAGSWFQPVPLHGEGWAGQALTGLTDRNVGGILPGSGPLADRFIVLGAHHDHLGRMTAAADGAPPPAPGAYYPGANDNASGLAVVLETVRLAVAAPPAASRRSLLVLFFCGEEVGLQGSAWLVNRPPVALDRVDVMINVDTVGQLSERRFYVSGLGTSPPLGALVAAANTDGLELSLGQGGWSGSDHMSFNTREVPVLFLFGGPYPEYNRPGDDAAAVRPGDLVLVTAFAGRLLAALRTTPTALPYVAVAPQGLREAGEAAAAPAEGNRDTWFGSLPDFTEDVSGYRLADVFADSPAQRAGLQKGDVLVRLAGREVVDLPSFTDALRANDPGDLVEVTVLRGGQPLNFTVVLGSRRDRR